MRNQVSLRRAMLVASALTGVVAASQGAIAQTAGPATMGAGTTGQTLGSGNSAPSEVTSSSDQNAEKIQVKVQRRLVREKDAPSAVTELGQKQIASTGLQGSPSTLLRQAPSVYVYQQGIGNNEPVLSIRGVRGLEVAETLDGIPMQDLLYGGTGGYLSNIIGGRFDLGQISGVSIYPGVAYPDENTFGTIGGTVAYSSLRPSPERYVELTGSVGSFGTYNEGITLNTGTMDGFLGKGYDAPSLLLKYSNMQTQGFVDYTPARYNDFEAAFDKPYDGGLSKFEATALYNTGSGYFTAEPIPEGYTAVNGTYSNYSPDQTYSKQSNDYLSIILKNDTYINDWLSVGVSAFYLESETDSQFYENINDYGTADSPGAASVYGENPFSQTIAGFGEQGYYGYGSGVYYQPGAFTYDGNAQFPSGSAACPASVSARFAAAGDASPCGYNAEETYSRNDTYGIQPRMTITPNEIFGIRNTIKIGGMVAKETAPTGEEWAWGTPDIPHTADNLVSGYGGGTYRTIYQLYAQDKIDFLHNTLHITPGLTLEGTTSGFNGQYVYGGTVPTNVANSAYCTTYGCNLGSYQSSKWDRNLLPFVNIDYDFDRILPAAHGLSVYGSFGESALYAPVSDFGPNLVGGVPSASIVHMYEGGVKYNTSHLALSADYFYQKVDRDFGFFEYQSGPEIGDELYTNDGQREFKGVEFSAIWQINSHWQLFWNGSHTLAKYLATTLGNVSVQEDQFGIVQKGTPVTGVPDYISTFGVDFDHKNFFLHGDEFHGRFEGTYTGHQSTSYDLTGYENVGSLDGVSYGNPNYYGLVSGATTYDPYGGIAPFVVFNLDLNYSLPVKALGVSFLKKVDFDLNILNLFDQKYWAYKYRQVSPNACSGNANAPYASVSQTNYSCTPEFADGLPGEPFAATFTMTARF